MNIYKVPFDFTHEEKVFGGYLSLRQMIYIIASIMTFGLLFLKIAVILKIIMFFSLIAIFMTFAFLKIGNVYFDKYFWNILKYIFRKKIFIFER